MKIGVAESSIDAVILGHFAAQRCGRADQAKAFLDEAALKCATSALRYQVVKYLRGQVGEVSLLMCLADLGRLDVNDSKSKGHAP